MIARLTGTLSTKSPEYVLLDVHGVGYGICVTLNTYYDLPDTGSETTLLIYTHVREDAIQLYGFLTNAEKRLFEHLIGVSKIGPKLARNILSRLSAEELKTAILRADADRIYSVPGIGEKTAQRLILELKDKIAKDDIPSDLPASEGAKERAQGDDSLFADAVSALINLGYSKRDAQQVVRSTLGAKAAGPFSLKEIIKDSLDQLSSK